MTKEKIMNDEVKAAVDMLLYCPVCFEQHVDEPNLETGWDNPPHRSHECQFCKHVWRPADVPTNGVRAIQTQGKVDGSPRPVSFANGKDFNDAVSISLQSATARAEAAGKIDLDAAKEVLNG